MAGAFTYSHSMKIIVQSVLPAAGPPRHPVAYVTLLFEDVIAVHDVRVIQRPNGERFVAMPNKLGKDGEWHDIVHPIDQRGRDEIHRVVMQAISRGTP